MATPIAHVHPPAWTLYLTVTRKSDETIIASPVFDAKSPLNCNARSCWGMFATRTINDDFMLLRNATGLMKHKANTVEIR